MQLGQVRLAGHALRMESATANMPLQPSLTILPVPLLTHAPHAAVCKFADMRATLTGTSAHKMPLPSQPHPACLFLCFRSMRPTQPMHPMRPLQHSPITHPI